MHQCYIADLLPFGSLFYITNGCSIIYEHFLRGTGSVHPSTPQQHRSSHILYILLLKKYSKVLIWGEELCWCKVDIRYNHISLLFEDWGDSIMEQI